MDEITIGDKVYVSSKKAAKITGYAKDYVGQLCREGRIEARLVGRNWYVLETALREHRFGKKEEEPAPVEEVAAPDPSLERVATWQKPQYEAEVPALVPELAPKAPEPAPSVAIADMQSAWKEWFEEKKPMQQALPDGTEDFKDEYLPVILPEEVSETPVDAVEEVPAPEVPVTIARMDPVYEPESEVPLHRSYASRETGERVPVSSVPVVDLSPQTRRARKERRTEPTEARSGALQAVFLVIALVAVLVAIVGTGHAERLLSGTSLNTGVQKAIVEFLGGTSRYESSL